LVAICELDKVTKIMAYLAGKVDLSRKRITGKGKQIWLILDNN